MASVTDLLESTDRTFFFVVCVIVCLLSLALWSSARPRGFPPGPRPLPFIGSIFSMTASPEEVFRKWSEEFGDVFGFKAGQRWIVVINRHDAIREALTKHGVEFAGRPDFFSFGAFTYGFKDIIFSTFSESWKLHHKLASSALRQFATGERLETMLHAAFGKLESFLVDRESQPVDPKLMITLLLYNVMSTMCFGKNYDFMEGKLLEWKENNERLNQEFGMGVAADFFPWARHLPTPGVRMVYRMRDVFHQFVWDELEIHKRNFDPDHVRDFVDLLLLAQREARDDGRSDSDKFTDAHLMLTVSNMFAAGIQTTTETLYWGIALMAEYQSIQAKIRTEIDEVVGCRRSPVIDDRGSLPFVEATLYEVMRYSSILPIAVPHATSCDVRFRGYHIPKGTVVMCNLHSMHFDSNVWDKPNIFLPERFLDEKGAFRKPNVSFLPFGAGRRSCLGEVVAKVDLFLIFTWLLQNYTFQKVPSKEGVNLLTVITNSSVGRHLENYEVSIERRSPYDPEKSVKAEKN
ncbi:steroid 17-alpha-hydroxylase/17,20 lyase-like [Diadema antillarum]|uniref:steroid 17-alpha-hydroxylase/17,20 lyase-like n=1 Tax=Diadema antillarum TaxID=105358 RepID=UPI003A85ED25